MKKNYNKLRQVFSNDPEMLRSLDSQEQTDLLHNISGKERSVAEVAAFIKGDKGEQGIQGVQGVQGEQGIQGIQGIQGEKGQDGENGLDGIDGIDGEKGQDGINPEIDTEKIKEDVIKELKKKQYLEPKDIKGMPLNMNDMRWHGGGLSAVSHDATLTGTGTPSDPLIVVGGGSGITSINADVTAAQVLAVGTTGTDFAIVDGGSGLHTFNLPTASASNRGALSSTDWTTFNNKQNALTIGNLTDAGTDGITIGNGTGAVIGTGTTITQHVADTSHNGYLSSTDWNTFNGKGAGTVTSVSGTTNRITSTGGATPVIDISASYVGQSSITTLGTIATGVWNGTKIGLAYGGTNADLSGTGGTSNYLKQSSSGAAITVGTIPASDIASGAILSRTNDTNVTLTLGGSPTTALLAATSLTLGWSGTLANTRGGTGGDSSSSTGVAQVSSGTWSYSTALANGTTATTQTSTDNSTKVATTAYVTTGIQNALNGLFWKPAVGYATTANVVGTNTAGVFTYTSTGVDTIDGHQLALNDVVLFKNQVTQADNGVWVVTTAGGIGVAGVLTRRSDYNTAVDIQAGDAFYILNGTANANTTWVQTAVVTTINVDALTFSQAAGPGSYVAGTGLTLTGNSFSVNASQTQITAVGTLTGGTWNATVVTGTYGGTGVNNGSKTLTYLKNISFTSADDTGVYTLPTGTKTLIDTTVATLSSLTSVGTITTGGLGTGATLGAVTVNIASTAVGDLFYAGASNVLTRLADVATGSVLISGGVTTAPSWSTTPTFVATNVTGLPAASVLAGSLGTGAYVMDTKLTVPSVINTANTVTVSSNAGTVPITYRINNFTNSSAATMAITMAVTSAVDGQLSEVRIYDASGVAQTIGWTNTENSTVSVPTTSNGSTTLPLSVLFQFNGATSKWRCLASA